MSAIVVILLDIVVTSGAQDVVVSYTDEAVVNKGLFIEDLAIPSCRLFFKYIQLPESERNLVQVISEKKLNM